MTDESAGRLSSLFLLSRSLSSLHDIAVAQLFRPLQRLCFCFVVLNTADGTFILTCQTKQITQMIFRTRQPDQTNAQPKSSSPYDLQTGEEGGHFLCLQDELSTNLEVHQTSFSASLNKARPRDSVSWLTTTNRSEYLARTTWSSGREAHAYLDIFLTLWLICDIKRKAFEVARFRSWKKNGMSGGGDNKEPAQRHNSCDVSLCCGTQGQQLSGCWTGTWDGSYKPQQAPFLGMKQQLTHTRIHTYTLRFNLSVVPCS